MPILTINGREYSVEVPTDTPLLWIIRENLKMTGTKFGCGAGLCGAVPCISNGVAVRSCQTQLADADRQEITTIEGLSEHSDHPLQKAWLVEQVPQCGYCQSGQIMQAASLLARTIPRRLASRSSRAMNGNLCRCMTYPRIIKAIERAANDLRAANDAGGREEGMTKHRENQRRLRRFPAARSWSAPAPPVSSSVWQPAGIDAGRCGC